MNSRFSECMLQETHFTSTENYWVLENDYVVLSSYGSRSSDGVFLLIECSLNADVNLVLADDWGQLVVADVKRFKLRVALVYGPNIAVERVSFFFGD